MGKKVIFISLLMFFFIQTKHASAKRYVHTFWRNGECLVSVTTVSYGYTTYSDTKYYTCQEWRRIENEEMKVLEEINKISNDFYKKQKEQEEQRKRIIKQKDEEERKRRFKDFDVAFAKDYIDKTFEFDPEIRDALIAICDSKNYYYPDVVSKNLTLISSKYDNLADLEYLIRSVSFLGLNSDFYQLEEKFIIDSWSIALYKVYEMGYMSSRPSSWNYKMLHDECLHTRPAFTSELILDDKKVVFGFWYANISQKIYLNQSDLMSINFPAGACSVK